MRKPICLLVAAAALACLAGCGSSEPESPVAGGKIVRGEIVLTAAGANRVGIVTALAVAVPAPPPVRTVHFTRSGGHLYKKTVVQPAAPVAGGPSAIIPYAALVYAPSGATYAFTNVGPLTYKQVQVTIDHISGDSVYLSKGPSPGTKIVTQGAEELFGVQAGVLEQT